MLKMLDNDMEKRLGPGDIKNHPLWVKSTNQ